MKPLINLILILVAISNIKGEDFSIYGFLKYLQETGIYDLFAEIKKFLGVDICVCFCEELIPYTNKCSEVIRVYINISYLRALRDAEKKELCAGRFPLLKLTDNDEEQRKNCLALFKEIVGKYFTVLLDAGFDKSQIEDAMKKTMKSISIYDINGKFEEAIDLAPKMQSLNDNR